jgi:excisionase family DNA binding protein
VTTATPPVEPGTITVREASRVLGIGLNTAYELARKGELPGVIKLGGRFVVSKAALNRLLDPDPERA